MSVDCETIAASRRPTVMVRLRTKLACAALLAGGLAIAALNSEAQATAPQAASPDPRVAQQPMPVPATPGQQVHSRVQPNVAQSSAPASGMTAPTASAKAPAAPGISPAARTEMPTASAATVTGSKTRKRGQKKMVAEVPQTPPPPPTLEQSAPTAPRVSLQNGQLTIDAHNSTLTQVLRAVQSQTGASMEIPGSANSERVVAQLGPGQPGDVLRTLLNGSRFDYVILGVTGNPGAVQKVILTPRQGSSVGGSPTAQNNPQQNLQPSEGENDEGVPVADNAEQDYQYQEAPPAPPPGGFRRPMMPPQPPQPPDQQSGYNPGEQQNGTKTPEQLMQELQQMQQQQQMYQQQLNPANQYPPQQ